MNLIFETETISVEMPEWTWESKVSASICLYKDKVFELKMHI